MLIDALYDDKEVLKGLLALNIRKANLLCSSIGCFLLHQLVVDVYLFTNVL
jgi:hypothetical protein